MASNEPHPRNEEGVPDAAGAAATAATAEDEDTGAHVAPIVHLEEVAVTTGEEHEDVLLDLKSKLYRFDKDGNQWKERGVGSVKLLKHKETGKVRLVMRQAKTLKICANHYVFPSIKVQEHVGNDKSCVWKAPDFADGELKDETFCIRFGSVENCRKFMEMVEEIAQSQALKPESDSATAAAELIENLKVGDSSSKKEVEEQKNETLATEKKEETKEEKEEESLPAKAESKPEKKE